MRLQRLRLHPYRLTLQKAWVSAAGRFTERLGYLVVAQDDAGHCGYGDCAPLPQAGSENTPQAHAWLQEYAQALEPAAGVNLAHLKETLGDRVTFFGGMDSTRVLSFGTPKDVEEDVKNCIKTAGHDGGYFAGPSHDILNVPWENMIALRASIEKYRNYPLSFN